MTQMRMRRKHAGGIIPSSADATQCSIRYGPMKAFNKVLLLLHLRRPRSPTDGDADENLSIVRRTSLNRRPYESYPPDGSGKLSHACCRPPYSRRELRTPPLAVWWRPPVPNSAIGNSKRVDLRHSLPLSADAHQLPASVE